MRKMLLLAAIAFLSALTLRGDDAYFIRFTAFGSGIMWADDVLFFNTNPFPVSVRFIGVSNGLPQSPTPDLMLPSRRTTSLRANDPITHTWAPNPTSVPLWVLHVDIPSGVIVESRDEFYYFNFLPTPPITLPRGKVSMPVFRGLTPANLAQVQLGTDLSGADSRINVGVYNGGDRSATATIEVKRGCDDSVVETRAIAVPANTAVQSVAVATAQNLPCTGTATPPWVYTVTTTVDQPSLTFVSNVNSFVSQPAQEVGILPVVSLAITKNERF
jgi:hypothetical protein